MTLQSGRGILCTQGYRTLHWCTLYQLIRTVDNVTLRFTDHTQDFDWIDGETYSPLRAGSITAEQRESMKESELEFFGVLDHEWITADDVRAGLYRNAILRVIVVDYRWPWKIHYATWKRIQGVSSDGAEFTATAMGLARELQKSVGRRSKRTCDLVLGGERCAASLTNRQVASVEVESVSVDRREFIVSAATLGTMKVATSFTVKSDAVAKTFSLPAGTWQNVPAVGQTITTSGFVAGGNNATWTVAAANTTVIQVVESGQVTATDPNVSISTPWYDNYFREGEVEWTAGGNDGSALWVMEWQASSRKVSLLLPAPYDIHGSQDIVSAAAGTDDAVGVTGATDTFYLPNGIEWDKRPSVGQKLVTTGFANPANNGTFTIGFVGWFPSTGNFYITVGTGGTLLDETAGATVTMKTTDIVTLKAGCDGLVLTCKTKFQNFPAYGGDLLVPGTNKTIQAPT